MSAPEGWACICTDGPCKEFPCRSVTLPYAPAPGYSHSMAQPVSDQPLSVLPPGWAEYLLAFIDGWDGEAEDEAAFRRIVKALAALEAELHDNELGFDLRHDADVRAIKRWQEATGREHILPDHADLCLWLINKTEKLEAAIGDDNGIESLRILLDWFDPTKSNRPTASIGRVTDRIDRVRAWIEGLARALTPKGEK